MTKINMEKTYVFYIDTWYVNCSRNEEIEWEEIWITEETTEEQDEKLLQEYFQGWLESQDIWWYEKD
jgi:hypothetical protein